MKDKTHPPTLSFQCPKKWESMQAAGPQKRFCDQCQLHVHDLSSMSKREALTHLAGADSHSCVSYECRPDGSMVTRTIWTRLGKPWVAMGRRLVALVAMIVPLGLASCASRNASYRLGGAPCVTPVHTGKEGRPIRTGRTNVDAPQRVAGEVEQPRLTGIIAPPTDTPRKTN